MKYTFYSNLKSVFEFNVICACIDLSTCTKFFMVLPRLLNGYTMHSFNAPVAVTSTVGYYYTRSISPEPICHRDASLRNLREISLMFYLFSVYWSCPCIFRLLVVANPILLAMYFISHLFVCGFFPPNKWDFFTSVNPARFTICNIVAVKFVYNQFRLAVALKNWRELFNDHANCPSRSLRHHCTQKLYSFTAQTGRDIHAVVIKLTKECCMRVS